MKRAVAVLLALLWIGLACIAQAAPPDSKKLESDLQNLPWNKFRSVIEAVPKLKADVEQYGSSGWLYVKANYKTYGWKKNIDKLDAEQKERLAELVRNAKAGKQ